MAAIDDEILRGAEDDAQEIAYIRSYLPQELKDKFSDEDLYYFIDVLIDYYSSSDILNAQPDKDGYVDIDLDKVVDYIIRQAKKENMGEYEHDDILFIVQAELEYNEMAGEEE